MPAHVLESTVTLYKPLADVFEFFSDPANLQDITPPWLHFRILTPLPIEMKQGAEIDYQISLRGVPLKWRTRISVWEPPRRFVDEQIRGPYRRWWHEHTFEDQGPQVIARDRVEYEVPGGFLEPVIHRTLVRPDVEKIFAYRREILAGRFLASPRASVAL